MLQLLLFFVFAAGVAVDTFVAVVPHKGFRHVTLEHDQRCNRCAKINIYRLFSFNSDFAALTTGPC